MSLHRPEGAAFTFLVVFFVILIGPALMSRARIPGIVGLLIGGWAIGPHGLGLIGQGNQTVPELGQFGLLYLMFAAGLELDLGVLNVYRRRTVVFGLAAFALPFACGLVVGQILHFTTAAAVLLGSLAASHTLITYPLVRDAGLAKNPAVATTVGATVLTDTLSLTVLAIVSGTQTGSGSTPSIVLELAVGFVVLGAFCMIALPWLAKWTFRQLGSTRAVRFLVALIAFLSAATVAHVFAIEGIVGAFFAGLALNKLIPNEGQTMRHLDFFGSAVFVPIFLVATGLLLDPSVMFQLETMKYAALIVAACLGGKALAALLAHLGLRVNRPEAALMWVISIPQAAATLAATTVGFEIGLFDTVVVNAVLVLILVSIVTSTVLVPVTTRRVEVPQSSEPSLGERVLLAVHDSGPSPAAAQLALRLARIDGGVVQTLLVHHRGDGAIDKRVMAALSDVAAREGFDSDVHVAVDRSTAHAVVHGSADLGASIVVVETALDAGDSPFGIGNWKEAVAATLAVPLVLVQGNGSDIRRVVLAHDGSNGVDPSAAAFVAKLAGAVARGEVVELDASDPAWVSRLRPGDLAMMAVPTFDLMMGLATPPAGAILAAVAETTIPSPDLVTVG
ncbi:MAG: cation:proton antiporter [Actinomycetes bacterium]